MNNEFAMLGIARRFEAALSEANYLRPTKIQSSAIPVLLEGKDVLGIAQTGTGKTAAFGLPLLQRLSDPEVEPQPRCPRGLVLAPTRELAIQISEELAYFAQHTGLRLTCIFGGVGQNPQVRTLAKGVDILVATPGRLLDLVHQKHLHLGQVEVLVLDEADRLMDMGFIKDVQKIVRMTPRKRQSLLFSATMPKGVLSLANEMLRNPRRIEVAPKQITVKKTKQKVVEVNTADKRFVLQKLLAEPEMKKGIVFTRTKHGANKLAKQLAASGLVVEVIHGNKSQNARNQALRNFSEGRAWVLVATDVAARGIDIDGVTHVFNFELPHEPESYVHRIGRTGRAGASGMAWALVDPSERKRLYAVEKLIGFRLEVEVVELPARDEREQSPEREQAGAPLRQVTKRRQGSGQRPELASEERPRRRRSRRSNTRRKAA